MWSWVSVFLVDVEFKSLWTRIKTVTDACVLLVRSSCAVVAMFRILSTFLASTASASVGRCSTIGRRCRRHRAIDSLTRKTLASLSSWLDCRWKRGWRASLEYQKCYFNVYCQSQLRRLFFLCLFSLWVLLSLADVQNTFVGYWFNLQQSCVQLIFVSSVCTANFLCELLSPELLTLPACRIS
jgi:hypothetical protein